MQRSPDRISSAGSRAHPGSRRKKGRRRSKRDDEEPKIYISEDAGYRSAHRPTGHHRPSRTGPSNDIDEHVLDDYYGGTSIPVLNPYDLSSDLSDLSDRPTSGYDYGGRPPPVQAGPRPERLYTYHPSRPARRTNYGIIESRMNAEVTTIPAYLSSPPKNQHRHGLWSRAAREGSLEVMPTLIITRRSGRYQSPPFTYAKGEWDDADFAANLKRAYRSLKAAQIGILQKIVAYKTIRYISVLQFRCRDDGRHGRWEIAEKVPITTRDDVEARDAFMYQLRYPPRTRRVWVGTLDNLVVPGAVIDLEVLETFDAMKIYLGLLLAILLSLATALVYGFLRNLDFSTGFSIASWMITAFGFFVAVVAAGEYFGLEAPVKFYGGGADLESGREVPEDMNIRRFTSRRAM